MRYEAEITASTGRFIAYYVNTADIVTAVAMVASGAQARGNMAVHVYDSEAHSTIALNSNTPLGMAEAVEHAMAALAAMPDRPHDPACSRDVVVEVHFAVDGSVSLDRARQFVEDAMCRELDACATQGDAVDPALFQYNGEVAHAPRWEN